MSNSNDAFYAKKKKKKEEKGTDVAEHQVSDAEAKKGAFQRKPTTFHHSIPSEEFPAEAGRYHLYISHACPWAHRCAAVRHLKGLDDAIGMSSVNAFMDEKGWAFDLEQGLEYSDPINGFERVSELYFQQDPDYSGRYTVPILYDKKTKKIVNNESSEIIRIFNTAFNAVAKKPELDLYPEALRDEIDAVNDWIYPNINDGVYRCGFARSQTAYDTAAKRLFEGLDRAEAILSRQTFLAGDGKAMTEADIRLWTTLIRFDPVYHVHFKCARARIRDDYPHLWRYTRALFQTLKPTVRFPYIQAHYFKSHTSINPHGIVPISPDFDELLLAGQVQK